MINSTPTKQTSAYLSFQRAVKLLLLLICLFLGTNNVNAAQILPSDSSSTRLYEHDIKFEGASVYIDGNYQYLLETIVDYLRKNPTVHVQIRGHVCCRAGKRISRRRARNVYRFLKRQGIEKERMTHAGFSNTIPLITPERSDEDKRRNRRVDFMLTIP